MAFGVAPLAYKASLGLIQTAELGLQELQIQKGEVEAYPSRVEVEGFQDLQEMEGVEGFQDLQEEEEGEVAFLLLQVREEEVGGCQQPQAKEEVGGYQYPQANKGVGR